VKNDFLLWTWLILLISGGVVATDALLKEDGDYLLLEDNGKILLET